jgi:hypothetical protein
LKILWFFIALFLVTTQLVAYKVDSWSGQGKVRTRDWKQGTYLPYEV